MPLPRYVALAALLCVACAVSTSANIVPPNNLPFANRTMYNEMCAQNRCRACISQPECGWCTTTWTCMYGNATGPQQIANGTVPIPCEAPPGNKTWYFSPTNNPDEVCSYENGTEVFEPEVTPELPKVYDTICLNGGQRYYVWSDETHPPSYQGGTQCTCPEGWGGVDCSVCLTDSVCGVPGLNGSASCQQALFPKEPPMSVHQQFSCSCTGPSGFLCNILGAGLDGSLRVIIDVNHEARTASLALNTCAEKGFPNILYSGISFWSNFTDCVFEEDMGACPTGEAYNWKKNGEPCFQATCQIDRAIVPFPPHQVHKCPNPPPSGTTDPCYPSSYGQCEACISYKCWDRSWRYRYCSDALSSIEEVMFYCQYNDDAGTPGQYECAFKTLGFGPVALSCATGACEYNAPPPPPPPPVVPPPPLTNAEWDAIILSVPGVLAVAFSTCCGIVLCRRKKELLQLQAEMERRAAQNGTGAAPAGPTIERNRLAHVAAPLLHDAPKTSGQSINVPGSTGWRPAPIPETVLSFSDLRYTIQRNRCSRPRQVLHGVSATVPSSIFAVLGPSGAGKTTMLDIIAGRKSTAGGKWSGTISLNGVKMSPLELQQCVGYILQDDVMMGTQSVREYLLWQTRMRLPQHLTTRQRHERVNHLLEELDLTRVASSKIGDAFVRGLSGGEKRRLSIAAELITDPAVLVVDEPTSGLDSANAKGVVDALVRVARAGRVVIMSIHQPRSYIWGQFDSLLLLGKGGEVVYNGRRDRCLAHFAEQGYPAKPEYNPADFLLDTVADLTPEQARALEAVARHRKRALSLPVLAGVEEGKTQPPDAMTPPVVEMGSGRNSRGSSSGDSKHRKTPSTDADALGVDDLAPMTLVGDRDEVLRVYRRSRAGFWRSLWELSVRTFTNVLRNPYLLLLNYVATIVVSVLTGLVFNALPFTFDGLQDRLGLFFFCFLYFGMTSLSSLGIWREERLLFLRERASNTYATGPYFIAKVACDILPLRVLPPIIFASLVYWRAGLHDDPDNFLVFTVVVMLTNVISATVCLAVGALVRNLSLANLVASLALLYALLLCGLLSHNADTGSAMNTFQKASYMNYAFEILGNNEFIGQTYNLSPNLPNHKIVPPFPVTGATVVLTLGLRLNEFQEDMLALCGFLVLFLFCVYAILRWLVKEER